MRKTERLIRTTTGSSGFVRKLQIVLLCCALLVLLAPWPCHAETDRPAVFLGPAIRTTHVLANAEGMERRQHCVAGDDRSVVIVACTASRQGKVVYETTWILASGLGVIALDDFKLVSVEKTDAAPQGRE
ncbi:hypothetical protein [Pseudodesulfovibrio sp.]|uniref:hypothetical protein n=1 Tax=Pseudodesulfovibrio sp. TaxID=2035812 RepID=UPI0026190EEF|nr:hypothetical protein [Pseudodesulfovibrio sp.]MDD3313682.1 hypothetical protein [Pseudodesulfovibrio sp.]